MKIIDMIKASLMGTGALIYDANLKRHVYEQIGASLELRHLVFDEILKHPLNPKYYEELHDITQWVKNDEYLLQRRQKIYFNNKDYKIRLQCISTFQIIENVLIIYQRSGDTIKMKDDFRFFLEVRNLYFPQVNIIKINYGSLHTEKM